MTFDIIIEDDRWSAVPLERLADAAGRAVLARLGLDPETCTASLLACDDARIAALNTEFRGKPAPTNVLSWPAADLAPDRPGGAPIPPAPDFTGEIELGDIALAWDTCAREAAEAGKPLDDHLTHLIVHGLLHLLGYDHESDPDATLMEGLETEIRGKLGVPDPYRVGDGP
ncbi:MAG TPA: rRNA maturation RNase YbeY [Rhodobacteraceae bacterium]|nr:rRNA maturation RNase YbeY [Paracoccaceae bacterium]